jgi:hypothetical protein
MSSERGSTGVEEHPSNTQLRKGRVIFMLDNGCYMLVPMFGTLFWHDAASKLDGGLPRMQEGDGAW